jgi:hypothetical protein
MPAFPGWERRRISKRPTQGTACLIFVRDYINFT